jgi:DNA-binding CsgD family transcriptional regulator
VDRDQTLPKDTAEVGRMVSELQLFASCAQETALHVLLPACDVPKPPPRLTAVEIDCLRWTMEGKDPWEIGKILHLAEDVVRLHLDRAARALSCVNTTQAVLKAMRLGLIR